jgi:crossover junction endodeoxyribonuclease RusA
MRFFLPWPPKELSPNARVHWRKVAPIKAAYRRTVWALALEQGAFKDSREEIPMTVTFCPPDNRRRDRDNMIAAFKAGFDGLADAMKADDSRFQPECRFDPSVPYGRIEVHIT